MQTRQTKFTAYATVYIIIIVAVLAMANFLAQRYNKSYDATANKQFSLSDQTVKVVKGLDKGRQPHLLRPHLGLHRSARHTYATCSIATPTCRRKLKVNYIDPEKKPQLAKANGVRTYPVLTIETAHAAPGSQKRFPKKK